MLDIGKSTRLTEEQVAARMRRLDIKWAQALQACGCGKDVEIVGAPPSTPDHYESSIVDGRALVEGVTGTPGDALTEEDITAGVIKESIRMGRESGKLPAVGTTIPVAMMEIPDHVGVAEWLTLTASRALRVLAEVEGTSAPVEVGILQHERDGSGRRAYRFLEIGDLTDQQVGDGLHLFLDGKGGRPIAAIVAQLGSFTEEHVPNSVRNPEGRTGRGIVLQLSKVGMPTTTLLMLEGARKGPEDVASAWGTPLPITPDDLKRMGKPAAAKLFSVLKKIPS